MVVRDLNPVVSEVPVGVGAKGRVGGFGHLPGQPALVEVSTWWSNFEDNPVQSARELGVLQATPVDPGQGEDGRWKRLTPPFRPGAVVGRNGRSRRGGKESSGNRTLHDRIERSMSVETAAGPFAGDGWTTHRLRDGTYRHPASAPGSTGIPPGLSLASTDRRIVPPFDGQTLPPIGICLKGGDRKWHDWTVMYETLFERAGLSLDRLRSFREILEAGGIAAASKGDPNRQSQLSRQVRELETFFGVELLVRGRGPMRPTPAGLDLDRLCGSCLGGLEEFLKNSRDLPVHLTVGAGESLLHWWLLPGLAGLGDTPGRWSLTFENLRNDEMLERLAQAALDIAVTTRFEPDNRLRAEVVGLIEYALFVPQGLMPRRSVRRGRSSSRSGGVLEGLPLAVLNSRSGGILRALESEASRTDCELRVALRLSSYPQLAMAVRSGTVAAVMPTRAAAALEGTQFEIHRPPFLAKEKRKVWIAWNRSMAEIRPAIPAAVRHLKRAVV